MTTAAPVRSGELTIGVVCDNAGRTRVGQLRHRYPQRVTSALHCDPHRPTVAVVCVQSPSGGLFSDDDMSTEIDAAVGTHLRVDTQAATQVFAGPGPGGRHRLRFRVAADAMLEYLPKTVIPHRNSTYTQFLEIEMSSEGTYVGWDALAAGRLGHGERYAYRCVDTALRLSIDGRVLVRDRQLVEPAVTPPERLIGGDYVATMLVVAPWAPADAILDAVRSVVSMVTADAQAGASVLPGDAGVLVRLATDSAPALRRVQRALLDTIRAELTRGAAPERQP